jgi:D-aminoacyl-tRNA deacylase
VFGLVYSRLDPAGSGMAERIASRNGLEKVEGRGMLRYTSKEVGIFEVDVLPFQAEFADELGCSALMFLSRHKSEAEVDAFTTHSLGNWMNRADFGGKPQQLSVASPLLMLAALSAMSRIDEPAEKTYEATHHGPLLKTPSLFVEIGGSESMIGNKAAAAKAGDAASAAIESALNGEIDFQRVVIGIGSNHYPERFTSLALSKGYAFSHIMPKYAIFNDDGSSNLGVLEQAIERSEPKPELAVVDWKSLNSRMKEETIKKLNEIGLDNEKV